MYTLQYNIENFYYKTKMKKYNDINKYTFSNVVKYIQSCCLGMVF